MYTIHRRLTALVLKADMQRRRALGLHEAKQQSFAGWLVQGVMFYANALSDTVALEALARFNITRADLEEGQALVERVVELNSAEERILNQHADRLNEEAADVLEYQVSW